MILFLWYYLHACTALGVVPLPVSTSPINVWAKVCNSCEVRKVIVSPDLIEYNNARFTRIVAEHEACHIFLGHDRAWSVNPYSSGASGEEDARRCTEERFWSERETEEGIVAKATEWDRKEGEK